MKTDKKTDRVWRIRAAQAGAKVTYIRGVMVIDWTKKKYVLQ